MCIRDSRSPREKWLRWGLTRLLPNRRLFGLGLRVGQAFRPVLPQALRAKVPPKRKASPWPAASHNRIVLALAGCVQPAAAPNTNAAAAGSGPSAATFPLGNGAALPRSGHG